MPRLSLLTHHTSIVLLACLAALLLPSAADARVPNAPDVVIQAPPLRPKFGPRVDIGPNGVPAEDNRGYVQHILAPGETVDIWGEPLVVDGPKKERSVRAPLQGLSSVAPYQWGGPGLMITNVDWRSSVWVTSTGGGGSILHIEYELANPGPYPSIPSQEFLFGKVHVFWNPADGVIYLTQTDGTIRIAYLSLPIIWNPHLSTCTVTPPATVSFGALRPGDLAATSDPAGRRRSGSLTIDCSAPVTSLRYSYQAVADVTDPNLVQMLSAAPQASGFALRITDDVESPALNQWSGWSGRLLPQGRINFTGELVPTGGKVEPGIFQFNVVFMLEYQ